MFRNVHFEFLTQVLIISICVLFLMSIYSDNSCQAQTFCDGEPRIINGDPVYSPEDGDPIRWTWVMGTTVSVEVYDTPDVDDLNMISNGVREWNTISLQSCSGVNFEVATRANRYWDGIIPNNTLAVVRIQPTQAFREYRNLGLPNQSVRAGRINLDPILTKNYPNVPTARLWRLT